MSESINAEWRWEMRWFRREQSSAPLARAQSPGAELPEELALRLARLIVDALEVGTGKRERDVIDELFEGFGLDFGSLDRLVPLQTADRTSVLRDQAAKVLAGAAPSATALLGEILKKGSRFIAMVDEVYARLAKHGATTLVAAEVFRVGREEIKVDLNISQAFLEEVREVRRGLEQIAIGAMDEEAVRDFIGFDNAECYGVWPLRDHATGFRLADAVHHLGWVSQRLSAEDRAAFTGIAAALAEANRAADRMCSIAEGLVHSHVLHLELLERSRSEGQRLSDDELLARLSTSGPDRRNALVDLDTYQQQGVLGTTQYTHYISGLDDTTLLGVDSGFRFISRPPRAVATGVGSGMADLATYLSMRRIGAYSTRRREDLETSLFESSERLADWLDAVRSGCEEAARWLSEDVATEIGTAAVQAEFERVREFLNLPLWHARDLLYEVWVLCATLEACEASGWEVELRELAGDIWTLTVGSTERPVASLLSRNMRELSLDVWREPRRASQRDGVLTPDVTIATAAPLARDLVVVEAKDRMKMSLGSADPANVSPGGGTAFAVARKYADGLKSPLVWVCNHCDYRQAVDPTENHGNPWSQIHVAGSFRPGAVPDNFRTSIASVISPWTRTASSEADMNAGLLLVIDWTGSFEGPAEHALESLTHIALPADAEIRAVLFADHGHREPFLVRKWGPAGSVTDLISFTEDVPRGGHNDGAALEDALSRCREIVADVGPQNIVILTDAPPHTVAACAYGIDYRAEVRALLEYGSRVFVADDWGAGVRREDLIGHLAPELADRLIRGPLTSIISRLAEGAVGKGSHP
jgi:hypothetical protein